MCAETKEEEKKATKCEYHIHTYILNIYIYHLLVAIILIIFFCMLRIVYEKKKIYIQFYIRTLSQVQKINLCIRACSFLFLFFIFFSLARIKKRAGTYMMSVYEMFLFFFLFD